jgi:hypothetical protein
MFTCSVRKFPGFDRRHQNSCRPVNLSSGVAKIYLNILRRNEIQIREILKNEFQLKTVAILRQISATSRR